MGGHEISGQEVDVDVTVLVRAGIEPLQAAHGEDVIFQGIENTSPAERETSKFSEGWVEATVNSL